MAPSAKAKTPTTASKTKRPVTLKHLAAVLAEEHQLTKRQVKPCSAISLA
jgi:hypothetical protein